MKQPSGKMDKLITTSWDDGHTLDFRIAGLLEKYKLKGTFYIPKFNPQNEVLPEKDILALSSRFEIGGHTLTHVNLKNLPPRQQIREIHGCADWLKNVTRQK